MTAPCAIAGSSRLNSLVLLMSLAAAGVTGCTGMGTMTAPPIALRIEDGARWIEPADLRRYQCEQGLLICSAGAGRLTTRLCRCVDGPANERPLARWPYSSGANAP